MNPVTKQGSIMTGSAQTSGQTTHPHSNGKSEMFTSQQAKITELYSLSSHLHTYCTNGGRSGQV